MPLVQDLLVRFRFGPSAVKVFHASISADTQSIGVAVDLCVSHAWQISREFFVLGGASNWSLDDAELRDMVHVLCHPGEYQVITRISI